jgi:hypothetical protein
MLKEIRLSVDPWMFLLNIDVRAHEILKAHPESPPLNAHCCEPILKGQDYDLAPCIASA